MVYIDKNNLTFEITLTLGSRETLTPPALALGFFRSGTNESVVYPVPALDITVGEKFVTISDIPTNVVSGFGQYEFTVYDYDVPASPVEIERGLCQVLTDNPINKKTYGSDKTRSEYQGHV